MGHSIGIFSQTNNIAKLQDTIETAAGQGFKSFWMPQIFGIEVLTTSLWSAAR